MQLEQGDIFEHLNANWIRENLPNYEPVWAAFIGHDGHGWPCAMLGLNEDAARDRRKFYQAHYSFARMMLKLRRVTEKMDRTLGAVTDYTAFEAEQDNLFSFVSYMGHVRDMFLIFDSTLSSENSFHAPLQEFYAHRSHVMHGPRLPVRIVDNLLMIPKIGGENMVFGEWDDKSTWDSMTENSFIYLRDFVLETSDRFFAIVNQQHGKVFDAANRRFEGRRILEPNFSCEQLPPLSGSTFAPAISAYAPPSGNFRG